MLTHTSSSYAEPAPKERYPNVGMSTIPMGNSPSSHWMSSGNPKQPPVRSALPAYRLGPSHHHDCLPQGNGHFSEGFFL